MNKYKNTKIYTIDYLKNNDLTEEDLHNIFDTKSLKYSLRTFMVKLVKPDITDNELKRIIGSKKYSTACKFETSKQFNTTIDELTKVYKNIYQYTDEKCKSMAEGYMIFNGLRVKNNNFFEV